MNRKSSPLALFLLLCAGPLQAQEGYQLPPQEVVDIIDAPSAPSLTPSPDHRWILMVDRPSLPSIAEVSRPMLRLAGTRIDPRARATYRTSFDTGVSLRPLEGGEAQRIPLPAGARVASVSWSHDSEHFAVLCAGDAGTELHLVATATPQAPKLLSRSLNTIFGGVAWSPDAKSLVARVIPEGQGAGPGAPGAPKGPNVQETSGGATPLRTYQDLLSNAHDEALFEHYASSQVVRFGLDGSVTKLGKPGLYTRVSASPDGKRFLVTEIHKPFSYAMPWSQFPQTVSVWRADGSLEQRLAEIPLAENVPLGGVRLGPRNFTWHPHANSMVLWVEALDGGDPEAEVEHRDRWMAMAPPYNGKGDEFLRIEERAWGLTFLAETRWIISREYDRKTRMQKQLLHDFAGDQPKSRVLEHRTRRNAYSDPGALVMERDAMGRNLVRVDDGWVYRQGSGASPEGVLPFLDRQNLETLETERLWRCEPGAYERAVGVHSVTDGEALAFLTRHESPESPSNLRMRHVGREGFVALSDFADPTPQLRGVHKEVVTYERSDGVPLSATLYLPPGYEEGTPLPLLVWAYPLEYRDPKVAAQVTSSPWRFTRVSGLSHLMLLTQGFAIMDGATMPILGDPETMNDNFVEQIVDAAAAAIDYAVERGVADRDRAVVGGHSYGAFMTANLLAHSDLFAAGVARSGAYNRSLTPFGFQSERRTFWEAPEAYFKVSPFMHAHKINEPLLMIHGEIDNNSGTFPMQSQRLFQAIQGNGGTARLVMLPAESHGYRARESVLQVHAETIDWFERFAGAKQ